MLPVLLVCAFSFVQAVSPSALSLRARGALQVRQSSSDPFGDLPTQCDSQCVPVENTFNSCTDDSCICTSSFLNGFTACLQCALNEDASSGALPPGTVASLQDSLNEITANCTAEGFNVPSETFTTPASGGSSSQGGSTASGTIFTTASASGSSVGGTSPIFSTSGGGSPTSIASSVTSKPIFSSVSTNTPTTAPTTAPSGLSSSPSASPSGGSAGGISSGATSVKGLYAMSAAVGLVVVTSMLMSLL